MADQKRRKLVLVRHSVPNIVPGIPASQWHLSDEGRVRCERLGLVLEVYDLARIVTSREPKAVETGQIVAHTLGIPFETAPGLHEHDRSNVQLAADKEEFGPAEEEAFRRQVISIFQNPGKLVYGAETGDQAHERFAGAIATTLEQHPHGNLAVVSHGTVMTLFVARAAGLDPVPFWKQLGLPSFVVISLPDFGLLAVVEKIVRET